MSTNNNAAQFAAELAKNLRASDGQLNPKMLAECANELVRLSEMVAQLTHERNALGEGIAEAAIKAGIARADAYLNGPQLLMLCSDMAESIVASQGSVSHDPSIDRLVKDLREHDDPRLYREADVLMFEAANTIDMMSRQVKSQAANVVELIMDVATMEAAPAEIQSRIIARAQKLKANVVAVWAGEAEDVGMLYRRIASETLRADIGWARAIAKSRECIELRERMANGSAPQALAQDPMQALADQAQELDMGYGDNACGTCGKSVKECCIKSQINDVLSKAIEIAHNDREAQMEKSSVNDGRGSDIAFGSVAAAERIAEKLQLLKNGDVEQDRFQ